MEPLVCAVMLTKDRPDMAKRAVECFRGQTYQNRILLVFDSGEEAVRLGPLNEFHVVASPVCRTMPIGTLRNMANAQGASWASPLRRPEILIHFDDDDVSHPNRIAEQVALLQASGKQAVGYRDMLFWRDERGARFAGCAPPYHPAETWLYSNNDPRYCTGTSLCYWRSAWEKRPFQDISRGEDKAWLREVDSLGVSSFDARHENTGSYEAWCNKRDGQPRMIASIHSGNHVVYEPEQSPHNWKRVPEWDAHARKVMSL